MTPKYEYSREYVLPEDLFRHLDKALPGGNNAEMGRALGINDKRVMDLRKQKTIGFYTADRLLSKLDLSYLLATGDIPVYVKDASDGYRNRSKAFLDAVPGA